MSTDTDTTSIAVKDDAVPEGGYRAFDFDEGQDYVVDATGNRVDGAAPAEVSTENDPEYAAAVAAAVMDGSDALTIPAPPGGYVDLPGGYIDKEGKRHVTCEVRELNGRAEEAMARALASGDLTRYVDTIIKHGVIQLGPVVGPEELLSSELDGLLLGDRAFLVMAIRQVTFGDVMRLDVTCPFCEHEFQVDYSFSQDVPVRGMEAPEIRERTVSLQSGAEAKIVIPTGRVQKLIYTAENLKKTGEELNTLLLSECIKEYERKPLRGISQVADIRMRDRRELLNLLEDNQPGPRYGDVKQTCDPEDGCGREFPLVIDVRTMFRYE